MVFKSVIRYILNRYLKNYIERLDDEKLDFDLRNGFVQLENLQLKAESLNDLNLPILVAAGHIERLSMSIPWMNLSRRPTEIHLIGLCILIVPKNEMERNENEERMNKMRKVQKKVEEMKRIIIENVQLDEKDQSLFEKLSKQILQNLRIKIENFHFSYQTDSTSKLGHPFAFGLTFEYLYLIGEKFDSSKSKSKNKSKWKENSIVYSFNEIRCLSIYWNRIFQSKNEQNQEEILKRLKNQIGRTNDRRMNFIHYPEDIQMDFRLYFNRSEEKFHRSSFDIQMEINSMNLHLNSKQFSDLLDFFKFQNYSKLYERCRSYRDLYLKQNQRRDEMTDEEQQEIQILERKLDSFNLAYIQFSVQTEIDEENLHSPSSRSTSTMSKTRQESSNSSRWNFWKKNKHRSFDEYHTIAMQISQMYSDDAMKLYFEDLPNLNVKIKGKDLHLFLIESNNSFQRMTKDLITSVHVEQSQIEISKRSISSNTLMKMSFVRINLFGYEDEKRIHLVRSKDKTNEENPLMRLELEFYPDDSTRSDYRFHWQIQPLEIIYSFKMFNRIVENFETNLIKENEFYSFKIEEHSLEQRENDLNRMKLFDLNIQSNGIYLIFPSIWFDRISIDESFVEIRLENVHLQTIFPNENSSKRKQISDERFYSKYLLSFNHFQIEHSIQKNRVEKVLCGNNSMLIYFDQCLYMNDRHLIDWLINVEMKLDRSNLISNEKIFELKKHFSLIPNFNSTIKEILRRINLFFVIFVPSTSMKIIYSSSNISFEYSTSKEQIFRIDFDFQGDLNKHRDKLDQLRSHFTHLSISHRSVRLIDDESFQWIYLNE